eukprot:CAMPEP_0202470732 /NCGR_PEP_ID=MMETSP1360-20130828/82442_1 /ASSEMBLY_ACC=CAM_ASM_000848 /TAXON_ID=515479 /ORGANISM="Licmophora paradoxa, Strain CCMP2313" /LENGTH=59 /DNA_ID=CAMNT_0049096535 /DNA_START=137 /DNA_END=316 /DNA_ORIENTATION=-
MGWTVWAASPTRATGPLVSCGANLHDKGNVNLGETTSRTNGGAMKTSGSSLQWRMASPW